MSENFYQKYTEDEQKDSNNFLVKNVIISFFTILITLGGIYVGYLMDCLAPFSYTNEFSDTPSTISASYSYKYNTIKIELLIDEIIEKWQVDVSNGVLDDITLRCKTLDGSLKKDFVFNDVEINRGEKIKCELIIEDATLNDFTTVKDLLGGVVQIYGPKIISLDLEERRKMKEFYTSGAALWAEILREGFYPYLGY